MKRILIFDGEGNYIEDGIKDDDYILLENEIEVSLNDELNYFKARLINGEIIECITQEELDAIKNAEKIPTQDYYLLDLDFRLSMIELGIK